MSENIKTIILKDNISLTENSQNYPMEKWFENLFGFEEIEYSKTKSNFQLLKTDDDEIKLKSIINNKTFHIGNFSTPSLAFLREQYINKTVPINTTIEHRAIKDILEIHHTNPGATFQVASQFNCLEFSNPNITPENGVTDYAFDYTQGPACAIACAAGSVYRNYFINSNNSQINNLSELENILNDFWTISNGYIFSNKNKLNKLNDILSSPPWNTTEGRDILLSKIRIGFHKNVSVLFSKRFIPIENDNIRLSQCYCSALSCGYSGISNKYWEKLARIVLDATYEAVVYAAAINNNETNNRDVFLTFLGGGVFQNNIEWIIDSIARAIAISKYNNMGLNFIICHYRDIDNHLRDLINKSIDDKYYDMSRT